MARPRKATLRASSRPHREGTRPFLKPFGSSMRRSPHLIAALALAPLLTFWTVEAWWGTRPAVVASMVLVALDVGAARWLEGRVPGLTWLGAALVLGLGGLSLLQDDPFWVLWAPAIGDVVLAAALVAAELSGRSVLVTAVREQRPDEPPDEVEVAFLRRAAVELAVALVAHGAVTAWSVARPRETWLLVSGPGQYVALGLWLAVQVIRSRRLPPPAEASDAPAPTTPPGS